MKINYQQKLDDIIMEETLKGRKPKLLLHSCCAPCSSYVLEYLSKYFLITVFYYNPNIYPQEEYSYRVKEQQKFISACGYDSIFFIEGEYDTDKFYKTVKGLENEKEGSERCFKCYELRLRQTAMLAKNMSFDYFTTTLSISPYKNAQKLNEIGQMLEESIGVKYLYSDFKKKNGYKRSIELSAQYGMYRQDYCGCVFSKRERDNEKEIK